MQRGAPTPAEKRTTRTGGARRGGLAAAALLVATSGLGLATTATSADAAAKKATVTVSKVAGVPKTTTGGAGLKVSTTVRNTSKKAGKSTIVFRLSRDKKVDGKDKRLKSVKTGKLRPKAAKKVTTPVTLPKSLAEGTYYVIACAGTSCKSAKTFVLRSDSPPPSANDQGTLSGTLTFTRKSLEGWSGVDDHTTVNVAMNYKGPFAVSNDLVSTSSTTAYEHNHSKSVVTGSGCTTTTTDITKAATRPLVVKGDRYNDEIYGDIVDTGFNELDVDLNIEYLYTTTVLKSGPAGCEQGRTETTHKSWDLMEVRLGKVSRSGSDITYQVKSLTGAESGPANWKDVAGTLTLHLG